MIIDGRALAQELNNQTATRVTQLSFQPVLCDIIVGDDPVSLSYVKIKQRAAIAAGFKFEFIQLANSSSTEQIIEAISKAQADKHLSGLLVQMPLPASVDKDSALSAINPSVDVDLLNPQSAAMFYDGQGIFNPPTAAAILHILDSLPLDLSELTYAVVGQGELVGLPTTYLLKERGYRVVTADINTSSLPAVTREADVVIVAVGKSGLITADIIKTGAAVIDAGTSELGGEIRGDVDFTPVSSKARYITPVPGGVGPLTVAKLLENAIASAERLNP